MAQQNSRYFLPYRSRQVTHLDLPINASEGDVFETTELTGCSVIVTVLSETHMRVFHDPGHPSIGHNMYQCPNDNQRYSIIPCLSYIEGQGNNQGGYNMGGIEPNNSEIPKMYVNTVKLVFRNGRWRRYDSVWFGDGNKYKKPSHDEL